MIWIYKNFIIYIIAFKLVYIYHYMKKYASQYIESSRWVTMSLSIHSMGSSMKL